MNDLNPQVSVAGGGFTGTIVRDLMGKSVLGAGFRPLVLTTYPNQNLYRNDAVGLNFEHILNGTVADRNINRYTPRLDPRTVISHSESEASIIHKAEDSAWCIASEMRYVLQTENAIDMTFTTTVREDRFPLGYVAFMWASYMNRARGRHIHFYGKQDGREGWTSFGEDTEEKPEGFETGTVSAAGAPDLPCEKGAISLNVLEDPDKKFLRPFYYGLVDGDGDLDTRDDTMVYIMMFDQADTIRFALWNFTRDEHGNHDPHSPAWDWQFVIRNPIVDKRYGYRARMVYKPYAGRGDVIEEYERWRKSCQDSDSARA